MYLRQCDAERAAPNPDAKNRLGGGVQRRGRESAAHRANGTGGRQSDGGQAVSIGWKFGASRVELRLETGGAIETGAGVLDSPVC